MTLGEQLADTEATPLRQRRAREALEAAQRATKKLPNRAAQGDAQGTDMAQDQQPEALVFANDRPSSGGDDLYQWAIDAEDLIRTQHARIVELETQMDAIGAGGVEPLRKIGCLHQISEPAQAAVVQQGVQPYAVLVFERGEEGPFERKPVKPGSVQHLHAKRDPHYDYVELYTHPTQQGLDAQDAARYRIASEQENFCDFVIHAFGCYCDDKESADRVIDAALAAQAKQGEQP